MGDIYERDAEMADMYKAGLIDKYGRDKDDPDFGKAPWAEADAPSYTVDHAVVLADNSFDTPDEFDSAEEPKAQTKKEDPARPEARRGRYTLPNPETGKSKSWQRVTNFVKLSDDTYHLELWKQRNVAKGVAILAGERDGFLDDLVSRDVKLDKDRLNRICEKAQEVAEAHKMAEEGTALHTSTELVDYAHGDIEAAPEHHRRRMVMYRQALAAHGLRVVPGQIERVTASSKYSVAGTLDRVLQEADGTYVVGDLKTGDSLDLSLPSIAAQLACYEDGINNTGIWDGTRYDTSIKVRSDYGIVIHLPSTREEIHVYRIDLRQGHLINEVNLSVREIRRIKGQHVSSQYRPVAPSQDAADAAWLERLNAAHTVAELVALADAARSVDQWNERLAGQARLLAAEINAAELGMGS